MIWKKFVESKSWIWNGEEHNELVERHFGKEELQKNHIKEGEKKKEKWKKKKKRRRRRNVEEGA